MLHLFPNYAFGAVADKRYLEASHSLILDGLVDSGVRVTLVGSNAKSSFDASYTPLTRSSVSFVSLGDVVKETSFIRRLLSYAWHLPILYRTVLVSQFCYIYVPGNVGILAVCLCWILRKPYALYLRGDLNTAKILVYRLLHRRMIVGARFILCTGSKLRDSIKSINTRVEAVVPMSPVLFSEFVEPSSRKRQYALRVLFVGQIIRSKGVFELLEAFDRIVQEGGIRAELMLVGDGEDISRLGAIVANKGLGDKVTCCGAVTNTIDLISIYRDADVFCLPTYYPEGFPRVLYEAMRFSLPILTTPVGQIPTVIRDGRNGLLCEPRSIESLTEKLRILLESESERLRIGRNGFETIDALLEQWRGTSHGHQVVKWLRATGFSSLASET